MNAVLIDAGPLVALLHRDDQNHQTCKLTLRSLKSPLASVWPAITEAMYLLGFSWRAQNALWELLDSRTIELLALQHVDFRRMRELMRQYRALPMDLADAALVAVAEREKLRTVFTTDRRSFTVYRPPRLGHFVIIP